MAETLEIKPEEQVEPEGHAEEMIKKAEGDKSQEEEKQQTQEELLAGKYKNEDELQKGILELLKKDKGDNLEDVYKSLESEVLTPQEEEKQEEEEITEEEIKETQEELQEASDVDLAQYEQEYVENGKLSEESYKELKEAGYPEAMVDRYIEGSMALAEKQAQEVYKVAGGEEQYEQMLNWASDSLTDREKQIFNSAVQSDDIDAAKFAVEALYGKFSRAEGGTPKLVQGNTPTSTTTAKFNSRQEVIEAMSNPKYSKDKAYRAKVDKKLAASDVF